VAAAKTSATAAASTAAKYGYTAHQWAMLGPTARNKIITAAKKTSGGASDTVYTSGPFAGRKKSEISALPDSERRKIVDDYNKKPGGKGKDVLPATKYERDFYNKYGVKPASTEGLNSAKTAISQAQTWIHNVLASNPKMPLSQIGQLLTTGQPKTKDGVAIPKQNALFVRVAMDIKQYGGITPGTADRLHRAGYAVAKLRLKNADGRAVVGALKAGLQQIGNS
jgi:hypothetical protein